MPKIEGIIDYKDNEIRCYRDTVKELKRGNVAYVYNENILNRIINKMPKAKINKKEFYWEVRNDI